MKPVLTFLLRLLLCCVTPLLLRWSFPPYVLFPLAWVALVPALAAVIPSRFGPAALYAFLSGLLSYAALIGWIGRFHYLSIPFVSLVFGTCFFAVPLLLTRWVFNRNPLAALAFFPAIQVVAELVKSSWFLKFPFANIGYTQARWLFIIQIADVTGIWGVQFLVAFVNILVFFIAWMFLKEKRTLRDRQVHLPVAALLALAVVVFSYSGIRLMSLKPGSSLRVGVVQTNQDPRLVWVDKMEENLDRFEALTKEALFFKPRVLFFPEGAVDTFVRVAGERTNEKSAAILNRVSALARETGTALLVGTHEEARSAGGPQFYNTALYFDPEGNLAGLYRKRELVPFGERDALEWISPSIQRMINRDSKTVMFEAGPEPRLLSVRSAEEKEFQFGVLICYESTIPRYARQYVRDGADFLVNITNDLWSLTAAGMYQHAVFSAFRAVETRTPVVRASNGGYSCYISSFGKMYSNLRVFREGSMPLVLRTLADRRPTVYQILGDWFAYLCIALSILSFAGTIRLRILS